MSAARAAECRAVLGGARDAFRAVWDEQATQKDRRQLLLMAGCAVPLVSRRLSCAWLDLPVEVRAEIKAALRRFKAWAEYLA